MRWTTHLQVPTAFMLSLIQIGNTCGPTAALAPASVRFAIEVESGAAGPLYAQVSTENNQPGWIRIEHATGELVHFQPRCDIPDCGKPPAVCGAGIPTVRDIAGAGRIEAEWDGNESVIDAVSGCERRQTAPHGAYVATFCFGRTASLPGGGDAANTAMGTVESPSCKKVPFSIPNAGVVSTRIP